MIAGTARIGSARSAANWMTVDDASPDAIAVGGMPARVSIWYWRAPAVAIPPGTIRPNAFPASWDSMTGRHSLVLIAVRCSAQTQKKLAISNSTIPATQYGLRSSSCRQDEKTSSRLGKRR